MTEWLVAKYMEDLRRREPRNVGVIVRAGDRTLARFFGERRGFLDGRTARGKVADVPTYKAWVKYWRHAMGQADSLRELMQPTGDDNYLVEFGGERLVGADARGPEEMLDYLYAILVEDVPAKELLSVAELSERLIGRLNIAQKVTRGYRIEIRRERSTDTVRFDYAYMNERPHLMQQVSLTFGDERSWDAAHAAAWSFEQAQSAAAEASLIALVRARTEDAQLERQLQLLEELANVVDVADQDRAEDNLRDLLHLAA